MQEVVGNGLQGWRYEHQLQRTNACSERDVHGQGRVWRWDGHVEVEYAFLGLLASIFNLHHATPHRIVLVHKASIVYRSLTLSEKIAKAEVYLNLRMLFLGNLDHQFRLSQRQQEGR